MGQEKKPFKKGKEKLQARLRYHIKTGTNPLQNRPMKERTSAEDLLQP